MAKEALSTAELGRMVHQILNSEEKESVETQAPRYAFSDCFRVPWQGTEIQYCKRLERGVVNCPVCDALTGMGDLVISGFGTEAELRFENLHVLEVHAGRVRGELIIDIDNLRKVLGVEDVPLVEKEDEHLQGVLMALWEIQNTVISEYYLYSRDMHNKRREGYLSTWRDRMIQVWFTPGKGRSKPYPLCGESDWKRALDMSLAEVETRVHVPAPARHLMEVHGLTEVTNWQVWNHPGDFENLLDFLVFEK